MGGRGGNAPIPGQPGLSGWNRGYPGPSRAIGTSSYLTEESTSEKRGALPGFLLTAHTDTQNTHTAGYVVAELLLKYVILTEHSLAKKRSF